jgi:pimeloyl-ACP methyl ester carboxylesterase
VLQNITISETYNIAMKMCVGDGPKKDHLHIATHGGGFDGRYWDIRIDPKQYSYVDNTLDAGYSILTYDRLGTGGSDKPSAYKEVQLPLQVEILREITKLAKNGGFDKYSKGQSFEKIIHVGHSLGSIVTSGLLAHYGELSDAAVITGFIVSPKLGSAMTSNVLAFNFEYPRENNPILFKEWGSGYLVPGSASGLQSAFFSAVSTHMWLQIREPSADYLVS